jgi:acetoin utilization deacetylase AcuC-like enzyme
VTLQVFYSPDYLAAAHAFDTTRKPLWVAATVHDLPGVALLPPSDAWDDAAIEAAIRRVHHRDYVDAIATGEPLAFAQSQGLAWDPGLWTAVRASTAGIVSAVDVVLAGGERLAGSLSSGLHHAKHTTGGGFCTVNGLVVAAAHAIERYDVDVTVLDVDARAGGGTDELLRIHGTNPEAGGLGLDRVRHLDLSTKLYDSYSGLTPRPGDINIEDVGFDDDSYLAAVDTLIDALPSGPGHLVLHNAGMDLAPEISLPALEERERRIVAALVERELAAVFTLDGGSTWAMTEEELAFAHAFTVRAYATALAG